MNTHGETAVAPEQWITCEECCGEGSIETPRPFHDDPYFCVTHKCEACGGADLERAVGIEPTTACLEDKRSTTELRPRKGNWETTMAASDYSFITNITWHRIVRTGGAFVREEAAFPGDKEPSMFVEYGPMPEAMMLPFIEEQKAFWNSMHEQQLSHVRPSIMAEGDGIEPPQPEGGGS